jgi:hypothetical protein
MTYPEKIKIIVEESKKSGTTPLEILKSNTLTKEEKQVLINYLAESYLKQRLEEELK